MRQVFAALEATPERGREFAAAVRHVLAWEDAWGAWKQAHCPKAPLELPPSVPPPGAAAAATQLPGALGGVWRGGLCDRVGAGGAMGAAQQFSPPPRAPLPLALTPTRHPHAEPAAKRRKLSSEAVYGIRVGTDELDRLWNLTEDNLSGEWVGCPVCGGVHWWRGNSRGCLSSKLWKLTEDSLSGEWVDCAVCALVQGWCGGRPAKPPNPRAHPPPTPPLQPCPRTTGGAFRPCTR